MIKFWVHGVGNSPVCQILLQIVVRAVITASPPAWTSPASVLSTPDDFPFFSDCTSASTFLRRMGWSSSVSIWGQFGTDGSLLALRSSEQYSIRQFSTSRSSVRHFPERSLTVVAFPCFTVVKFFHKLICTLTVVLAQIFFSLTTLFSYPIFFCLFHAPLDVVVRFLVFLRSFKFESVLFSVLSFCHTDQEFLL